MQENQTEKDNHNVAIAVMQKDVEYIKNSLTKIETTLAVFDRNFARKDEVREIEKIIKEQSKEIKEGLANKVNREEFYPIRDALRRINWMIISTCIVAVLSLIIKAQ